MGAPPRISRTSSASLWRPAATPAATRNPAARLALHSLVARRACLSASSPPVPGSLRTRRVTPWLRLPADRFSSVLQRAHCAAWSYQDIARELRADRVSAVSYLDRQQADGSLPMADADPGARPQIDLRQEPEQLRDVVLYLHHFCRLVERQVDELEGIFMMPQLAVRRRDEMAVRTGRGVFEKPRQMVLDQGRDGVLQPTGFEAGSLP